jgi:hypothetical protein
VTTGSANTPSLRAATAGVLLGQSEEIIGTSLLLDDGYVVTCAHVVREAAKLAEDRTSGVGTTIRLCFPYGREPDLRFVAEIAPGGWSPQNDIAILKIQGESPSANSCPFGDARNLSANYLLYGFGFGASCGGDAETAEFRAIPPFDGNEVALGSVADPTSIQAERGFSGAPVFDGEAKYVYGLFRGGRFINGRNRYRMISANTISKVFMTVQQVSIQNTNTTDAMQHELAKAALPILSAKTLQIMAEINSKLEAYVHEVYCAAFSCSCFWGKSIHSEVVKIANTAESLIFLSGAVERMTEWERETTRSSVQWLMSQVRNSGLPSLTFSPPYDTTVHCTALGISGLALISSTLYSERPTDQCRIREKIKILASSLIKSLNHKKHGWKTLTHEVDRECDYIRVIPTLMVVRSFRHADIEADLRRRVVSRLMSSAQIRSGAGIGLTTRSKFLSYSASLFLLSEICQSKIIPDGSEAQKIFYKNGINLLNEYVESGIAVWRELEEIDTEQYKFGIERVSFTHVSYAYAIDMISAILDTRPDALDDLAIVMRKLVGNLSKIDAIYREENELIYPRFLIAASASLFIKAIRNIA